MKYTVNEFIEMTKQNPDEWIGYCEILILNNGMIELARPSHTEKMIEIYCEKMNIATEYFKTNFPNILNPLHFISEKYRIVAVWYSSILIPGSNLNRFQEFTIRRLQDAKLLSMQLLTYNTEEYSYYKRNKKFRKLPEGL